MNLRTIRGYSWEELPTPGIAHPRTDRVPLHLQTTLHPVFRSGSGQLVCQTGYCITVDLRSDPMPPPKVSLRRSVNILLTVLALGFTLSLSLLANRNISDPNDISGGGPLLVPLAEVNPESLRWLENYITMHNAATSRLPAVDAGSKFIVYVCEAGCGGIGDRLSGLMSVFYLAVAMKRVFLIDYSSPVDLELTLVPKRMRWNCSKLLPADVHTSTVQMVDTTDKIGNVGHLHKLDLEGTTIIRIKINRYWLGMHLWARTCDKRNINQTVDNLLLITSIDSCDADMTSTPSITFALAFNALFTFSSSVLLRAQGLYTEMNLDPSEPYVAMHVRLGGSVQKNTALGWEDPKRHDLDDVKHFISCAKSRAAQLLNQSVPIVLFTDRDEIKSDPVLRENGIISASSTSVIHVDRSLATDKNKTLQGNIDTFAELYVLSRSSCLVGSVSTFSGVASSMLLSSKVCFCFFSTCDETVDFWQATESLP